ncbi:hypothetical protein KKI93_25980, partial [Xenorhabdus bovienii]|nr:hypothetical protein [Xenorhabdus bovienii]
LNPEQVSPNPTHLNSGISDLINSKPQIDLTQIVDELKQRWDTDQVPSGGLSIVVGDKVSTLHLGKQEEGVFELASTSKAFTGLLIA